MEKSTPYFFYGLLMGTLAVVLFLALFSHSPTKKEESSKIYNQNAHEAEQVKGYNQHAHEKQIKRYNQHCVDLFMYNSYAVKHLVADNDSDLWACIDIELIYISTVYDECGKEEWQYNEFIKSILIKRKQLNITFQNMSSQDKMAIIALEDKVSEN